LERLDDLAPLNDITLAELGRFDVAAWPAIRALTTRMLAEPSASRLDDLKTHGPAATVQVDIQGVQLPADLMLGILSSSAHYPLSWVMAAERRVSMDSGEPPLGDVAVTEKWFSN